jgi:CRISPR-associated endonuclease/helicase Cas3
MEFADFFCQVHGHRPFPWQERLARKLAMGECPRIRVPTGLGKSAAIDAAVWAAVHAGWRRIVFVIDRRIVVDEVYDRAIKIQQALRENPDLASLHGTLGEVQVVRLRGGLFGDDEWVLYPDRLSIVLSTVDQVGSRLLNRGYGVGPRRWPLHAGFFGSRCLLVIDEAHLSTPFLSTLEAMKAGGAGIHTLPMSATMQDGEGEDLALDTDDLAHPVIRRRLSARKRARLLSVADKDFIRQAVSSARELGLGQPGRRVAVIVNRVATARAIHDLLESSGERSVLVIGRCRSIDRENLLAEYLPELKSGRPRNASAQPIAVVATQTVEVGADFDFDALVTESASLSALRQRFGRLDRLGELGESTAHIIHRAAKRPDPVYGDDGTATWTWLQSVAVDGEVDLGLAALDDTMSLAAPPSPPVSPSATLLPSHLQLLAQSGPYAPVLDVSAWLHGPQQQRAEISLVWRADLPAADGDCEDANDLLARWVACMVALPPSRREALDMPLSAVRRWLLGGKDDSLSDMEGDSVDVVTAESGDGPLLLRWRGQEDSELINVRDAHPGDTLILPAALGGCDPWGWAPDSKKAVADRAEDCRLAGIESGDRSPFALRLWPGRFGQLDSAIRALLLAQTRIGCLDFEDADEVALEEAEQALRTQIQAWRHPWALALASGFSVEPYAGGVVLRARGIIEDQDTVETGVAVALDVHHGDVARWAQRLADTHRDVEGIVAAAAIHDEGKREARMQVMLHGDPLAAATQPPLAKSGLTTAADRRAAWKASGMPRGFRHELASLTYAQPADPLISHLVGSHHGYGRPWFAPCSDPRADGADWIALGGAWHAQFAAELDRHGLWGLAEREWLLRAADARASMEEAQGGAP